MESILNLVYGKVLCLYVDWFQMHLQNRVKITTHSECIAVEGQHAAEIIASLFNIAVLDMTFDSNYCQLLVC